MSPKQELLWSCKCGEIQAKLYGNPILEFNCHCRSCVAGARFIAEKTNHSGIPIIDDNDNGPSDNNNDNSNNKKNGGTCVAAFTPGQVEFIKDLSSNDTTTTTTETSTTSTTTTRTSKLKFIRIGENGELSRCYTTCCGTQMTNYIHPRLIVLNRNAIQQQKNDNNDNDHQSMSKYSCQKVPLNVLKKYAFDPSAVPEPNHETSPLWDLLIFNGQTMNPFSKTLQYKELFPDISETEVVPITWE